MVNGGFRKDREELVFVRLQGEEQLGKKGESYTDCDEVFVEFG